MSEEMEQLNKEMEKIETEMRSFRNLVQELNVEVSKITTKLKRCSIYVFENDREKELTKEELLEKWIQGECYAAKLWKEAQSEAENANDCAAEDISD